MYEQIIVLLVIGITLFLFIDGRIRYDFVSLSGILILTVTGVISPVETFGGFSHPAVITVASVLVISSALIKTGVIDILVDVLNRTSNSIAFKVGSLMTVTALLSAFMNNVGALALILPIALRVAKESKISPSVLLMPVAFASLFGGMITAIGTPPNLIVSSYRAEAGFEPFLFFDFAPVGLAITIIGILFVSLIGWRLIPERKSQKDGSLFRTEDYLSEVVVTEGSKIVGKKVRDFHSTYNVEVNILSIIRKNRNVIAPHANEIIKGGDILVVRAITTELTKLIDKTGFTLKGAKLNFLESEPLLKSDEVNLVEVVVREDSYLIGRTAFDTRLRNRFNINLVAVSRRGTSSFERLKSFRFKSGDILLLQVPVSIMEDTFHELRLLPLAESGIDLSVDKSSRKKFLSLGIFILAILLTAFGIIQVQIAFSITALLFVLLKIISAKEFYEAIEWPTIIMLGSLLPLGGALQSSGASDAIANGLMRVSTLVPPAMTIVILMVINIILTNLISNSASAALMAPIAVSMANFMEVSPDPLLMALSVASATAFMTPIAHQSNVLVMGPGGYKFTDYWKLGLPLSILTTVVGAPLIYYLWAF